MNGEDFPKFFDAVWRPDDDHSVPPFPWQARLARQVVENGTWPELLDLPTGAGKTAVIDIAIFALACRPSVFPRRTVYVVDRRIVVDQVARRVERLQARLSAPDAPAILVEVAKRLRALFGASDAVPPVHLAELRGGIAMDSSWSLRPDVPAVLVSTVDQVGSRLLHRGYGVSDSMLPIHAGLTGNDCLYVLDEVHLSQPFAETLRAIRSQRGERAGLPDRFQAVELSATPGEVRDDVFRLGPEDRDPEVSPILARRLSARKPATVISARMRNSEHPEEVLPPILAEKARKHEGTVAVIVNRVETARRVAKLLDGDGDDVLLLTGRMRPWERDARIKAFSDRLMTGRDRSAACGRLFVVGTQSLEVGADFDFDALITECASWDALRQRFGRVDRDGVLSAAGNPATVTVVHAGSNAADDPVYGGALAATWTILSERVDGFDAGLEPDVQVGPEGIAPRRSAPLLLPSHWQIWAQTRPRPHVEPDPALWLHGPETSAPDVDIVWRADLSKKVLAACASREELRLQVEALLRLLPPLSGEALPVPITAARAWLEQSNEEVSISDTEGGAAGQFSTSGDGGRPALRVQAGRVKVVYAKDVRPGDTLVVPCAYGGLDRANWSPGSTELVTDLAREVREAAGLDDVLRLLPSIDQPPMPDPSAPLADQFDDVANWVKEHFGRRPARSGVTVVDYSPEGDRFFVVRLAASEPSRVVLDATAGLDLDGSDERNSFVGAPIELHGHCSRVGALARCFAERLGLPEAVVADLELAGQLHDLGKADPRFQRWLAGGSGSTILLAKSALRDPRERAQAREASGYPRGTRHELLSLALLNSNNGVLSRANDADLVCHLVASHHGWCRPWAPAVEDDHPVDVEVEYDGYVLRASSSHGLANVGSGIAERFFALLNRYGWHGLAWLESILRLADHRRSEIDELGVP